MMTTWQRFAARGLAALVSTGMSYTPAYAASHPALHSMSERYHANPSAATGRSGSASLSVRALRGHGGTTDVEISTGDLDSAQAAPGSLRRVQVKAFDGSGGLVWTHNFNQLSGAGTVDLAFGDLARGQPIQVQANVTGIDGHRTDVVTVNANVSLRPDLAVESVTAPARSPIGMPVNVSAAIDERNGDTGAHGDCVLSIDGAEVARTSGIWVDAGGAVSCAFSYTFTTAGTHVIGVAVSNVSPADDDASDDSAETAIEITQPSSFKYTASVSHTVRHTESSGSQSYSSDNGSSASGSVYSYDNKQTIDQEQSAFSGQLDGHLGFPFSVALTESSDGAAVASVSYDVAAPDLVMTNDDGTELDCAARYDMASAGYLYICAHNGGASEQGTLDWTRYGGTVTYFNSQFTQTWWRNDSTGATTSSGWAYNSNGSYSLGPAWNVGSTYGFDVTLSSDGKSHHASPSFATEPYSTTASQPYTCTNTTYDSTDVQFCSQSTTTTSGVQGSASGTAE
jgi:hypothetical protein